MIAPRVIGRNAGDVVQINHELQQELHLFGRYGITMFAISGLDIALWDLKGQYLNQPIYELLGGKVRNSVPVYASSMKRDLTPSEEAARAADLVKDGYKGYKLHSAVPGKMDDPADQTIKTVTEVRKAVGDGIDILVDVNGAYSVHHSIEIGKKLEALGVFHFEEPRPHYDLEGLSKISEALTIPIASGEMIFSPYEYRDLIIRGKVDIIQPDIVKAPGFTGFLQIEKIANAFGIPITCHNTQQTVSTVAHGHFVLASEQTPYKQEYNIEHCSIRDDRPILKEPLDISNGELRLADKPGLGIELDLDTVRELADI